MLRIARQFLRLVKEHAYYAVLVKREEKVAKGSDLDEIRVFFV